MGARSSRLQALTLSQFVSAMLALPRADSGRDVEVQSHGVTTDAGQKLFHPVSHFFGNGDAAGRNVQAGKALCIVDGYVCSPTPCLAHDTLPVPKLVSVTRTRLPSSWAFDNDSQSPKFVQLVDPTASVPAAVDVLRVTTTIQRNALASQLYIAVSATVVPLDAPPGRWILRMDRAR
jgi:hypothetical protein